MNVKYKSIGMYQLVGKICYGRNTECLVLLKQLVQWGTEKINDQGIIIGLSAKPMGTRKPSDANELLQGLIFTLHKRSTFHGELKFDCI